MSSCNPEKENPIIASIGFENCEPGDFIEIIEAGIRINGEKDKVRIYPKKGKSTPNSLHLVGGETKSVEISNVSDHMVKYVGFSAERWTSKPPFQFKVEAFNGDSWNEICNKN